MSLRMTCSCLWLRSDENDGRRPIHSRPVLHNEPSQAAPPPPEKGAIPMSSRTAVCELLGIEHPVVSAPMAADPRLPAAVSNAGALGTIGLWWADDAGDLVRETAALTDRPFGGNFALTSDQHRRVDQALAEIDGAIADARVRRRR